MCVSGTVVVVVGDTMMVASGDVYSHQFTLVVVTIYHAFTMCVDLVGIVCLLPHLLLSASPIIIVTLPLPPFTCYTFVPFPSPHCTQHICITISHNAFSLAEKRSRISFHDQPNDKCHNLYPSLSLYLYISYLTSHKHLLRTGRGLGSHGFPQILPSHPHLAFPRTLHYPTFCCCPLPATLPACHPATTPTTTCPLPLCPSPLPTMPCPSHFLPTSPKTYLTFPL